MNDQFDVIILGAGVAGLSAATALREAGLDCIILEAAARPGGRAWTTRPPELAGAAFDHGASWLHAAGRNPLLPIALRHADPVRRSEAPRARVVGIAGRLADTAELAAYSEAQDRFDAYATARALASPDISFAAALAPLAAEPWTASVSNWEARLIAAADPDAFSLRDWHDNALDDDNATLDGGLGAFVARRLVPQAGRIALNSAVRRLDWRDGITATTDQGAVQAQAAIVTVSTGVLAAGRLRFDPALPAGHAAAIDALPMGLLTKVAFRLAAGAPADLPASFSLQRQIAPGTGGMFFNVRPHGADHVVGFVGGPDAWALAGAGTAAAEAYARSQWRACLGAGSDACLLGPAIATDWGRDPAQHGAYAYARPGRTGARAALGMPLADGRLVFAGEAVCTDGLAGTVGGAWNSGRDAAESVARALGRTPAAGIA